MRARYPDRWRSLATAAGDEVLVERVVVASAVKSAVIERLPSASNAQNGSAPYFRGDGQRILRVYEALREFITTTVKTT